MKNFISIPKPCNENWDSMTPQEQGRHCAKCNFVITDFSALSNEEILEFLKKTGRVCGRVYEDQLYQTPKFTTKLKRFIYALALAFLPFVPLDSIGQNVSTIITATSANFGMIQGIVVDSEGIPISNAGVVIYKSGRFLTTGKTNSKGKFSFKNLRKGRYKIDIQAENFFGLYWKKIKLSKGSLVKINVTLKPGREIIIGMCHPAKNFEEPTLIDGIID